MLKYRFDVEKALTEAGAVLSEQDRIMAADANRLDTETLARFCNILKMTPPELIEELRGE